MILQCCGDHKSGQWCLFRTMAIEIWTMLPESKLLKPLMESLTNSNNPLFSYVTFMQRMHSLMKQCMNKSNTFPATLYRRILYNMGYNKLARWWTLPFTCIVSLVPMDFRTNLLQMACISNEPWLQSILLLMFLINSLK